MTRFAWIAIAGLVVVTIAGMLLATPVQAVRAVQADGTVLACARAGPGTLVTLTFTHSMYGGDVTETWVVGDGVLERRDFVTENAAAAEYYAWDGRMERAGDRFVVVTEPLQEDRLVVRVDQIGRHVLTIGSGTAPLYMVVDDSAQVRIEPFEEPLIKGSPC